MANIKIERVPTIYGCEFFTEDREKHIKAITYLKKLGITDIRAGVVESPETVEATERAIVLARPEPKYVLYAILRGKELGYIGLTYQDPPSKRVDEHLKKAREAAQPFMRWLADGYEANDVKVQYWPIDGTYSQAKRKEQIAIRTLKPLYNRNNNGLALPITEEPTLFKSLNSSE